MEEGHSRQRDNVSRSPEVFGSIVSVEWGDGRGDRLVRVRWGRASFGSAKEVRFYFEGTERILKSHNDQGCIVENYSRKSAENGLEE